MKKIAAVLATVLLLLPNVFMLTVSATVNTWETPEFSMQAYYNEKEQTVTVQYRILKLAGTESADLILRYNKDIVKYDSCEKTNIKDVLIEVNDAGDGRVAIQFIDMYCVKPEDCEEDGSAVIATVTFAVTNANAESAVFIATADSYDMDPNTTHVYPDRATLKVPLNSGSIGVSTHDDYSIDASRSKETTSEKANVKKIVIAAVISAVIFVALLAAVVIKYRKSDNNTADKKEN